MDAELKAKWIAALRSGKYEQGRQHLRQAHSDGHAFCCLGVLCDIAHEGEWGDGFVVDSSFFVLRDRADQHHDGILEGDLCGYGPSVFGIEYSAESALIKMNDDGAPFSEIADYIEAHL